METKTKNRYTNMENVSEFSKIPMGFIHTLRLLQYEQRKLNQLISETSNKDLKTFLRGHLSEAESNIDQVQEMISNSLK